MVAMSREVFKVGYINYLDDYSELDYFVNLILSLDYAVCQNIDLYIASSVPLRDDTFVLPDKFHKVYVSNDYKSIEFQELIKSFDLGIVPSQLEDIMSLSSIEFLKNDIPILCGAIGGDKELSTSKLFRFENNEEFYNKFINLYNNPKLLSEYNKNYSEVTEQYIKETVAEEVQNA